MTLVELEKVTKSYRKTGLHPGEKGAMAPALQETDLLITAGQSLGILGRSGAGKTTLGKLICGLEPPTSGSIIINGSAPAPGGKGGSSTLRGKALAATVQMIWQDAPGSLNPRMRIAEIIAEPLRIHGLQGNDRGRTAVARLLDEVSLPSGLGRRYPHELSGGEVQRVAIARALALDPDVLVCDEPASALDVITKMQIADLLARLHRERGMTLLLIAHDMPLIRRLTDWLLVMQEGAIVEEGPTRQLLSAPRHTCTREIVEAEPVWLERQMETSAG